jgi:predicted small lipoprotein YifL
MTKITRPALLPAALLCIVLTACGQRGPLYLPTPEDASPPPASSAEPPADTEDETR